LPRLALGQVQAAVLQKLPVVTEASEIPALGEDCGLVLDERIARRAVLEPDAAAIHQLRSPPVATHERLAISQRAPTA
jgi:hypothetical protein